MDNRNQTPNANAWGKLRSTLARMGMSQAEIKAAIGEHVSGRTRAQIAEQLRAYLQSR